MHSQRFFAAILEEFPDSAKPCLSVRRAKLLARCVFFFNGNLIVMDFSLEYFSLCPNNLLYWEMIRWGCELAISGLTLDVRLPAWHLSL